MDVEKRLPVTNLPPASPPPQDLNLPPPPQPVLPPSPSTTQDVEAATQPSPVLERPREHETAEGEQKGEPPSQEAKNAKPHSTPQSPFSMNLISAFKLDPLAATVARYDPKSGEKINKMRKSYENYLKTFGLLGKNRSVKHEEAAASAGADKLMSLSEMGSWPGEEWQMQKVHGKDIKKGLPEALKGKLEKALTMNPGPISDQAKWDDILGIDRPSATANNTKSRKDGNGVNGTHATAAANSESNNTNANAGGDHIRARRNTKKRRYDDGSFEGYGEGFVDDEMENDGYESGETYTSRNSRGSKGDRKRRKTQDFGKSSSGGVSRTASFASTYNR